MKSVMINPDHIAAMMVSESDGEPRVELLMTGGQVIGVGDGEARDVIDRLEHRLLRVSGTP